MITLIIIFLSFDIIVYIDIFCKNGHKFYDLYDVNKKEMDEFVDTIHGLYVLEIFEIFQAYFLFHLIIKCKSNNKARRNSLVITLKPKTSKI